MVPSSMDLLVSVMITTYQHEKYIEQAVTNIIEQVTDFSVELIIADDCSPDDTSVIIEKIIKQYNGNKTILYFRHPTNYGAKINGPFALSQCKGKYIAFCEGDDYWSDPNKLQKQVDFLEQNPDYIACFHDVNVLETDGNLVEDHLTVVPARHETLLDLADLGNFIHTPSIVFKTVIKELPDEFKLAPVGDYFLYLILAQYGKFKYIPEKMAVYRNNVGMHSTLDSKTRSRKYHQSIFLIWLYFRKRNLEVATVLFDRVWTYLLSGEFTENIASFFNIYPKLDSQLQKEMIHQMDGVYSRRITFEKENHLNQFLRKASIIYLLKVMVYKMRMKLKF